eukprot:CAMPEP_0172486110 /NCGR_PEP_ID=MMETSP1066-20121228/14524_1 /TAXON_ID=671091 /ORGANISM="Coscinodiscus wailesii, Strain CCMP2513" /LENGTH=118 /DNA_ID=CAMNT_0013251847 /DNA_START=205 /DNA_END=561 /DNA_ORIENTATION=+
MAIESLTIENIDTDHEDEGERMAKSITAWLDAEWMPQETHIKMGQSAKSSYIACRKKGEVDLMNIMTTVVDDLQSNWREYDDEAFINAWDVGNYVSDYLAKRAGVDGCACSATIYDAE